MTFKKLAGDLTGHVDNLQKTLGDNSKKQTPPA